MFERAGSNRMLKHLCIWRVNIWRATVIENLYFWSSIPDFLNSEFFRFGRQTHLIEVSAVLLSDSFSLLNKTLRRLHCRLQFFSSVWQVLAIGFAIARRSETLNHCQSKSLIGWELFWSNKTRLWGCWLAGSLPTADCHLLRKSLYCTNYVYSDKAVFFSIQMYCRHDGSDTLFVNFWEAPGKSQIPENDNLFVIIQINDT